MNKRSAGLAVSLMVGLVGLAAQTPGSNPADELYAAIRGGDMAKVNALVKDSTIANVKERRGGATPLMNAAAFGSLETMRLLIEKGADVNGRNTGGATALMWAVSDFAKVRLLVDRGADVNIATNSG